MGKQVTGGTSHEFASLSGITVKDTTYDLCTTLAGDGYECPVDPQDMSIVNTETIGDAPSGLSCLTWVTCEAVN
jgi:hypothetical protein